MSKYYHATVTRRPVQSTSHQAKPVAEVVFESENPDTATQSILKALDELGVAKADLGKLIELGEIEHLSQFPFGPDADKPDWNDKTVKVWATPIN